MVEFSDLLNKKEIIMKNAVILIIFAIAIVCTAEQYIIPYSTENVTIDGSIDQLEWQDALHIPMHSENMYIVFDEPNDVADLSGDIYRSEEHTSELQSQPWTDEISFAGLWL